MRKKISVIIIAKNEEKMIEDCLKSLVFPYEEVIVVDNGSTDQTVKLAVSLGARVVAGEGSFSKLRNLGRDCAQGDWLFYLDADERISPDLQKWLENFVNQEEMKEEINGFKIKRNNNFLGRWMKNGGWNNEYLLRLMKKENLKGWMGDLHETAEIGGKVTKIDCSLWHYSHRDLTAMVDKTNLWSVIEAKNRLTVNHPKMTVPRFIKLALWELGDQIFCQHSLLDGDVGLIETVFQTYSLLITYFKLWEMQNQPK